MSPNDIKRIVNCVVDYEWPWQFPRNQNQGNGEYYWTTHHERDVRNLCRQIGYGFEIRLDPNHVWDWPVETREGMPCWAFDTSTNRFFRFDSIMHARAVLDDSADEPFIAINPIDIDQVPPADWSPEDKRILK